MGLTKYETLDEYVTANKEKFVALQKSEHGGYDVLVAEEFGNDTVRIECTDEKMANILFSNIRWALSDGILKPD